MKGNLATRRIVLKAVPAAAAAGAVAALPRWTAAQQVKWSTGTEAPKFRAPADAADCHHHIYDAKYSVDPRSTLRPGDASVEDYRALQRRIGTSRNAIVQPSTYGADNSCTRDALVAFGPAARAIAVVDTSVSDSELKRISGLGVRGIRFNLALKIGPPSYSDSSAVARAYVQKAPARLVWGSDWPHPGERERSRTMPSYSTFCSTGLPTSESEIASSCRTRRRSTAFRRAYKNS